MTPENPKTEEKKIDLKNGLEVENAKKINEIAANNSKDFSDALKKQVEGINNKKELAKDILNAIDKGKNSIKEDQISIFKTLLDNIAQLDPDIKSTLDFKKRTSIVTSTDNFKLWKEVINAGNLKATIEKSDIAGRIKNLGPQDQELKNHLDGIVINYKQRVEERQKDINALPLYQLEAYGIVYDAKTGELKNTNNKDEVFPLFNIDEKTQREYNPKMIKEKDNKTYLELDKTTKIELTNMKVPSSVREHIGYMQAQNDMQGLDYIQIKKYIEETTAPTSEEKSDLLMLITEAKRLNPTDAAKYDMLVGELNQTKTKESQEKTGKDIDAQVIEIINQKPSAETAKKLFDTGEKREVTNKILETTKNNRQSLSPDQKDNITNLIKLYIEKSEPEISKALTYQTIQDAIKTGKELNHRPETYNGLPVYVIQIKKPGNPVKYIEMFSGTEKDIHTARSQTIDKTKVVEGNTLQPYEAYDKNNNTIDLRKLGDGVTIDQFIAGSHEFGSYMTLEKILKTEEKAKNYLKNNLSTVLEGIKNAHKGITDSSVDHTNGYYRVIAETIVNTGDKGTIKAYLTHIQSTPSYLGDGQSRIDTRNIIAKRGDANILKSANPEDKGLQNLYLLVKSQIDPTKAKGDILEQVDANLDKFMETFGPAIAMVVDFLGGKGTFMKMLPSAMRDKFKENFKKNSEMKGKEGERFDALYGALIKKEGEITDEKILDTPIPNKTADKIIEDVQGGEEQPKLKIILEKNFTSLSPSLVYKVINEYNKSKKPEEQIKPEDVVTFNAKGAPESVKDNATDKHKEIIVAQLLHNTSPMWKDIKNAYEHTKKNSSVDLRTEKEADKGLTEKSAVDINGSETYKGIGSYADVAVYIAAYVSTAGGNTPYHHVISENDKIVTSKSHKEETTSNETSEQKIAQEKTKFNTDLLAIKTEIEKTTDNAIPTTFDVLKISTDNDVNKKYFDKILNPLNTAFSSDKKIGNESLFSLAAANKDILTTLKSKPQIIKDLLTYSASKETDAAKKAAIEGIATTVTTIKDIKNDNGTIIVQIDDKQKFIITAGPVFELPKETPKP